MLVLALVLTGASVDELEFVEAAHAVSVMVVVASTTKSAQICSSG